MHSYPPKRATCRFFLKISLSIHPGRPPGSVCSSHILKSLRALAAATFSLERTVLANFVLFEEHLIHTENESKKDNLLLVPVVLTRDPGRNYSLRDRLFDVENPQHVDPCQ